MYFKSIILFLIGLAFTAAAPITLQQVFDFVDTYHSDTPLYGGLGDCDFPVTTTSTDPDLQKYMNMGVCMIHTFWPSEAIRAFRRVVQIDPTCAMGYWGLWQALDWDFAYAQAKNEAAALAQQYVVTATEREQLYVSSLFASDSAQFNATFQQIFSKYPWDTNARALWSWETVKDSINYMGYPKSPTRQIVQQFLANETKYYPNDVGYQHYTIHAWEDTFYPYNSLDASEKIASISPNAGHNVHMPGHIFYLLNDHDRAHEFFLMGMHADLRAMGNFSVNFMEYWEYIHNLAYLVGNLGEGGRFTEGINYGTFLRDLTVDPSRPMLLPWDPTQCRAAARYYFQGLVALPFLYFQYAEWNSAIQSLQFIENLLNQSPFIQSTNTTWLLKYYDGLRQYACVMQEFKTKGDVSKAEQCLNALKSQYDALEPNMNETTENGFQVGQRSWIALGVNYQEAAGAYVALSQQDFDYALSLLSVANKSEGVIPYNEPPVYTRPVLATYADVLEWAWEKSGDEKYLQQKVAIYTEIIHNPWHNNSGFGWYGIGYTNAQLENVDAAVKAYNYFLDISWKSADQNLTQVKIATDYVKNHPLNTSAGSASAIISYVVVLFVFVILF